MWPIENIERVTQAVEALAHNTKKIAEELEDVNETLDYLEESERNGGLGK